MRCVLPLVVTVMLNQIAAARLACISVELARKRRRITISPPQLSTSTRACTGGKMALTAAIHTCLPKAYEAVLWKSAGEGIC
jgi:hypothetical protein